MLQNSNFGQKSELCSKIEILVRNTHLQILLRTRILVKNPEKSKYWSRIQSLGRNQNFARNPMFGKKSVNFGQKF